MCVQCVWRIAQEVQELTACNTPLGLRFLPPLVKQLFGPDMQTYRSIAMRGGLSWISTSWTWEDSKREIIRSFKLPKTLYNLRNLKNVWPVDLTAVTIRVRYNAHARVPFQLYVTSCNGIWLCYSSRPDSCLQILSPCLAQPSSLMSGHLQSLVKTGSVF